MSFYVRVAIKGTIIIFLALCVHSCALFLDPQPEMAIPKREPSASSGDQFQKRLLAIKDPYQREDMILAEARRGNIPAHLRALKKISWTEQLPGLGEQKISIWVSPDYLSIGSNQDYLRTPTNPITAQKIADHYGMLLPTRKLVDIIYKNADIKLKPLPMPPDKYMVTTSRYIEHDKKIQDQLSSYPGTKLIAGHKKDIVISNKLRKSSDRVAIYGWHRSDAKAIQPLSTVHKNYYADYSHGVRLIANIMSINGKFYPVAEVLQDKKLARLISDEGTLNFVRYATEGTLVKRNWTPGS